MTSNMNRTLCFLLLFSAAIFGNAQGRNANWLMAGNNWLSFNGTPPTAQTGSGVSGQVTSCMSNPAGTLLFFGDDSGLLNASLQTMANGPTVTSPYFPNNLPTNPYQGRLLVPKPGEPGRYIAMFNGGMENALFTRAAYGEVDMNLNGGLGAWVDSNLTYLADSVKTMMNGTPHANGTDYWVVLHKQASDRFLSYRVNASGVDPNPVTSQAGSPDTIMLGGSVFEAPFGQLTFSLQGDRMALGMSGGWNLQPPTLELFNFDRSTGSVSYYASIDSLGGYACGTAFSPDGTKLYVHEADNVPQPCTQCYIWRVWQYEISDPSPSAIMASKVLLKELNPTTGGPSVHNMMMGPDGKIYVYQSAIAPHNDKLGVVNYPNLGGASCAYDEFGVQLQLPLMGGNLPNQLLTYHDSEPAWLGVQEAAAIPTLCAFPNPVTEELRIVPPAGASITGLRWLDATGREVRRDPVAYGTGIITAARGSLAPGAYLVQALSGQRTVGQVRVVVP
jgi:hypothetical protein